MNTELNTNHSNPWKMRQTLPCLLPEPLAYSNRALSGDSLLPLVTVCRFRSSRRSTCCNVITTPRVSSYASVYFSEQVPHSQRCCTQKQEDVAGTDAAILILGETGTRKELIARAVHHSSPRQDYAFVRPNCSAIPSGLLESELFGHEKRSFTGAIAQKIGRLELAHQGIFFLDEVGVGTRRETVTWTVSEFRSRQLVALQGSTLMISNRSALETIGGA